MSIVLEVENVSKKYKLGVLGMTTIRDELRVWWAKKRGLPNPLLKVGQEEKQVTDDGTFWALRDINFKVEKGEILGIIGKNGAGKSTLLKLLSQITSPTTGKINIKGRVASLLEVGTGFNGELTGRENVYLNGAILGMTKTEVKTKLDEIILFSGIEHHIDTPVKRYSSGMKVRLGFAVAAHLEPEILIIDEVLAVGDAEFQKKCIGKIQDVAGQGRTVLFVSHNMNAVNRLCTRAILLVNGMVKEEGDTKTIVDLYLKENFSALKHIVQFESQGQPGKDIELLNVKVTSTNGNLIVEPISVNDSFNINIQYRFNFEIRQPKLIFRILNSKDEVVLFSDIKDSESSDLSFQEGIHNYSIMIEQPLLKPGLYSIAIGITNNATGQTNHILSVISFKIVDIDGIRSNRTGYIYKKLTWKLAS